MDKRPDHEDLIAVNAKDAAPLPDRHHYRYAGQRVENAVLPAPDVLRAALAYAVTKSSVHPVIPLEGKRYMITNVQPGTPIEELGSHYLFPYYEREEHEYLQQEQRMLSSRIQRFVENAQAGIYIARSPLEIRAAQEHYRTTGEGGPELVGSILRRMNELGKQIIANRKSMDVPIEGSTDLVGEFRYYYMLLINGEQMAHTQSNWRALASDVPEPPIDNKKLLGSVRLANGEQDIDGLLYYFAHETGKVLAVETSSSYGNATSEQHEVLRRNLEMRNREAVTTNVAWACEAIDHMKAAMHRYLIDQPTFKAALKRASGFTLKKDGVSSVNYGYFVDDFVNKARARACVRLKDSDYFRTIDEEFSAAANKLSGITRQMRAQPRCSADTLDALKLADEGIELIYSMARSRMPRDHHAPAFNEDMEAGKEQSSVALYEAAAAKWAERPRSTGRLPAK